MFQFRGIPMREINGLPYTVHQINNGAWQVVIQNCARHPAGYTFAPVYQSYEEALQALTNWPTGEERARLAGDDTGVVQIVNQVTSASFED